MYIYIYVCVLYSMKNAREMRTKTGQIDDEYECEKKKSLLHKQKHDGRESDGGGNDKEHRP